MTSPNSIGLSSWTLEEGSLSAAPTVGALAMEISERVVLAQSFADMLAGLLDESVPGTEEIDAPDCPTRRRYALLRGLVAELKGIDAAAATAGRLNAASQAQA